MFPRHMDRGTRNEMFEITMEIGDLGSLHVYKVALGT